MKPSTKAALLGVGLCFCAATCTDESSPGGVEAGVDAGVDGAADAGPQYDCEDARVRCVDDTAGPTQEYETIQECAGAAQAGDVCLVHDGTYDERVTPSSGVAGSPIIFQAQGQAITLGFNLRDLEYVDVIGFELTTQGLTADGLAAVFLESSNHIRIIGNTIHHTDRAYCIRMRSVDGPNTASSHNVIGGNHISYCSSTGSGSGPGIGIGIYGDSNLVEGNDISHLGDDFVRMTGGRFNVIRNNLFHDNSQDDWPSDAHIDGMQNWCTAGDLATAHLLIENNTMREAPSPDTHFIIYQDEGGCGNADFVVRYNTVTNLGSYVQINDNQTAGVRLFHNTFAATGIAYTPKGWTSVGWQNGSTGGKLLNNIFYDTTREGGYVYSVDPTSQAGFEARANLAYESSCGSGCSWGDPIASEADVVLNQDPQFASLDDGTLQPGSPAIDRGGALTRAAASDSGSGTSLVLEDAGFFQDGWAGVDADWIAVGEVTNTAQIASIDYTSNTVTLASAVTRAAGASVWLYRDSVGTVVLVGAGPDIGAHEWSE